MGGQLAGGKFRLAEFESRVAIIMESSVVISKLPLPLWYYIAIIVLYIAISIIATAMFLGQVGLFAKISDPRLGGTYMTLLNTVANLAFKWPTTLVYFLVDSFTTKSNEI